MSSFIQLHSDVVSIVIKLSSAPEIVYWGAQLGCLSDTQLEHIASVTSRAVPQARLDHDVPVSLCPEIGRGTYGSPGLEGHHFGRHSTPIFEYHSHTQTDNQVAIRCIDDIAKLELLISLSMDSKTGVVRKSIQLTNNNESAYQLNKLVLTLPLPYHAKELESYTGRWSREFQPQRAQLEHGVFTQENRRGRTSHEYFPGCLIGSHAFSEEKGEVWGFHLAWSGNHSWRAEAKSDGRRFVQAGELLFAGEIELAQGESYTTPELYASYSQKGINGLRKANHSYVREHLLKFDVSKPRPVHLNSWEGIYFEHDPEYICEMATQAAQIGVERFIIDDGWFKGRDHDKAALGDWVFDRNKYPNGLTPVIEHVNKLGMEFGIWVEPEMFNPDSDLFRTHPDWLLAAGGYPTPMGRYQYVLNLQNQDCFGYLYKCLDELLSENNIGYVKWDMNRELVQATHNDRAAVHGQTKAVYRLLDKLVAAHPEVEIESCSSGGGRIDYEILKRTYRFWTSDCNDALERQTIQKNMGIFFPPEVMGAHIGPQHSHTTRRQHDINLRGITALAGHMGVELDPVKENEEEKQAFAKYIALHKQYRHLLHSGDSFYLDNNDKTRHAYGVYNAREALLTVSQLAMPDYMLPEPVRLSIFDPDSEYKIKLVEYPKTSAGLMKVMPDWVEQGEVVISGAILKQVGITLPVLDPEACLLIHMEKI
ncbi:alpha-galactosidase [Vibrio sp. SG41-7]|uniref:alpha-galactosidase n=1 Tax=Vibrio sp. SG41-7 TaxID=2760973 RepID=UPI00386ACF89